MEENVDSQHNRTEIVGDFEGGNQGKGRQRRKNRKGKSGGFQTVWVVVDILPNLETTCRDSQKHQLIVQERIHFVV